jgi:hypothetical protein
VSKAIAMGLGSEKVSTAARMLSIVPLWYCNNNQDEDDDGDDDDDDDKLTSKRNAIFRKFKSIDFIQND